MSNPCHPFWSHFENGALDEALDAFITLDAKAQIAIFQELFEDRGNASPPFVISVLKRKLKANQTFHEFYNAWFPDQSACKPINYASKTYQQHFPLSTRVLNGIKIDDSHEVISIGMTWVKDEGEKNKFIEYIESAGQGKDKPNQDRHESIEHVADGELIGLYLTETDDQLGTPFNPAKNKKNKK